jgi:hypothetical protein
MIGVNDEELMNMQHCSKYNHMRSHPPKQMNWSGVQAVINGEDRSVNNVYNTDTMLITCDNKTDIFISKSTKDKNWNLEYTDLSLPVRHNFNCQKIKHKFLSLADGQLLMHLTKLNILIQ